MARFVVRNGDKVEEAYIETRRLVFLGETTAGQVTMGRSDAPSSSTASTSYDSRHDHYHEPLRQDNDIDQPLLFQVPLNSNLISLSCTFESHNCFYSLPRSAVNTM
eukprot:GHVT01017270.1.p1 GENE.GHVT01017270.1~~GHVT01017270.1.p1  ORF type:complete len:106 (+),score=1.45 GHVT01017270.1:547-864(+)